MAKKRVPIKGKKVNTGKRGPKWSELKPGTQKKYKASGVTPQRFNAWRHPKVRAKAKAKGIARWQYLGLDNPQKISGLSKEAALAQAYRKIEAVFGDAVFSGKTGNWASLNGKPSFSPSGARKFLHDIDPAHVKKIALGSERDVYGWAFAYDEDFADENESRNEYGAAGNSGGYLFYH